MTSRVSGSVKTSTANLPPRGVRARRSLRADRRRRTTGTRAGRRTRGPARRGRSPNHDVRPLVDPALAVRLDLGGRELERVLRHDGEPLELRGQRRIARAGNTNICRGMSSWKRFESMKSTSLRAPSGFRAPRRTPASSICRKQRARTTPVGALDGAARAKITSAGGLDAYETTIGRLPLLPAAPEKRA